MLDRESATIGTVGDAYDNALAETAIGFYKAECVRSGHRSGWVRSPGSVTSSRPCSDRGGSLSRL